MHFTLTLTVIIDMMNKYNSALIFLLISIVSCVNSSQKDREINIVDKNNYTLIVELGIENEKISKHWYDAISDRMNKQQLDSLKQVKRKLTEEEFQWHNLIQRKVKLWPQMIDSIKIPFGNINIDDTTYVLLGYLGNDDAFTFQSQTVCFDLTALNNAYGSALNSANFNRIDRFFAHEYTHLLSNEWARLNKLQISNYQDSILWECIYEGIGMYRSMSAKWFPVGDSLSEVAAKTFEKLYPEFTERMSTIFTSETLTEKEKEALHKNLSRGSMTQKWGALPVGVWLALESNDDDKNLIPWIDKGPDAVLLLAKKYLPEDKKGEIERVIEKQQLTRNNKH